VDATLAPMLESFLDAIHTEEMERLASRLALLVSDSGEADNAGRAVGILARKLGLSGGDLKQIFLAGLRVDAGASGVQGDASDLAREAMALRRSIAAAEAAARDAGRERDALRAENDALQQALDNRRSFTQVAWALGTIFVCAVAVGAAMMFVGPSFHAPRAEFPQPSDGRFAADRGGAGGGCHAARAAGYRVQTGRHLAGRRQDRGAAAVLECADAMGPGRRRHRERFCCDHRG
jgi:hypothetical protein